MKPAQGAPAAKRVLITGAGRGIGKRLALGFAGAGAHVGLVARSEAEIDLARLEIEHAGGQALAIPADVRDFEQLRDAVRRFREHFGDVDVLVAGAAIQGPIGPFAQCDPESWANTIAVNLVGVMHACRAVLPSMIDRRSGKVIVLTGGGTTKARPNFSAHAASKAALARFVETLAEELLHFNIQVNCMSPGGAYTHMTDEILRAGERAGAEALQNAKEVRLTGGTPPEKQIQLALFLASEKSNHVSGKIIHVTDDWKRLEHGSIPPAMYTLRRVHRV